MSSTALPANAQPWRDWLGWFATPLALAVNQLVRGLQPLLTPMRGRPQPGDAEPDGLDDLRRRGSYERLLPTEWLLAEELPDEFLRRAAAGEHLFFATRPRAERQRRQLVVLFDAGPAQLGAPRLAHLALWILLARRAELAGMELRWGLLQAPCVLHPAAGAAQLKALLAARSWSSVQETQQRAWAAWFENNASGLAECWRIGSAAAAEATAALGFSHSVRIANSLDPGMLDVALQERAGRRAVQLRLPPAPVATALLGGRFDNDAQPGLRLPGDIGLAGRIAPVFSPDGRHVAIAMKNLLGVAVFRVPRQRDAKPEAPRRQSWSVRNQPIGILLSGSRAVGLMRDREGLSFWQTKQLRRAPAPDAALFAAPPGTAVWRSCYLVQPGQREMLIVHDAQRRLVAWSAAGAAGQGLPAQGPKVIGQNVVAVMQVDPSTVFCLELRSNVAWLRLAAGRARRPPTLRINCSVAQPLAYLAITTQRSGAEKHGVPTYACAVRIGWDPVEVWQLCLDRTDGSSTEQVTLEAGERGVGLVCRLGGRRASLVVLAPNRRQFYECSGEGRETIYASAQPVSRVTVCPTSGDMALLTADGQLVVYALPGFRVRLSVGAAQREAAMAENGEAAP